MCNNHWKPKTPLIQWISPVAAAVLLLAFLAGPGAGTGFAEEKKIIAQADWPQFRGPNSDSIALNGPKLLDAWPKEGPKLLWKSGELPFAPTCGVGTPVVAGGKVYTYAQIALPIDGVKPFNAEFLLRWGWAADMPADLAKKLDAATADPKYAAVKNTPDPLEAYTKEFLATLDSAQSQKFADAVRNRMKTATWWSPDDRAWMASFKDKDIKSRQEFMNLFIDRFHHGIYHGPQAAELNKYADTVYKDQKWADQLICLDAATGKSLWSKEFPGIKKSWGVEFGCSGVPTIVKDKLYFAGSGGVYCLDLNKQGELIWQGKGEGSHTSPAVADGVAYFCAGVLAAYNADTGKELWRQPRVTSDAASPLLWKNNGKTYVICAQSAPQYQYFVYCVDAANGAVLWQEKMRGDYNAPAILGDIMVVRSTGGASAYRISPQKAEQMWTTGNGGDYGGSPIIYQDHVYMCGQAYTPNILTVLDLKTGAVTLIQRTGGGACSTGIVADGKIVFVCESGYKTGRLIVFKANPDKFEGVGQLPEQDAVASTSPALADGKVYYRMPTALACYDLVERGVYLDGVGVRKDALTFRFKQTGGGLAGEVNDLTITDAAGAAKPAMAKIDGDNIVVDIKDAAVPFTIAYKATGALKGKNGLPLPAFEWNESRVLNFRKCFDNTIMLASQLPLQTSGNWNKAENFAVAGAKVTRAELDPSGKGVILTTDKTWKPGDAVTLTYPSFQVEQGDTPRATLKFTVLEVQRAAAKFVKTDESTAGTWKGVYGAEGALLAGESGAAPKCAVVTIKNKEDCTWAGSTGDARAPQKTADAKDRIAACWFKDSSFDIDIEISDGKEHQAALYCLDWDGNDSRAFTVELRDMTTNAVLDTQTVKAYSKGKHLVWNLKGQVTLHIANTGKINAVVSGIFFDVPAGTK